MLSLQEIPEAERSVKRLLSDTVPDACAEKISVRPGEDADGDPSLFVKIILREWPATMDGQKSEDVVGRFRTWLVVEKSDERFPYFEFVTRDEEREREKGDGD